MFDANARYIPKGVKFFASGWVDEDCQLYRLGVKSNEPYLCKMLDNTSEDPRVSIKVNGKVHIVKGFSYSFLTYEGTPNGKGFICDKSKAACEKLIGGFNSTYWKRN